MTSERGQHRSEDYERQSLLEVERARSADERRLLIARELRRLAAEALSARASDRRSWPPLDRLRELQHQADVLYASAIDTSPAYLLDTLDTGVAAECDVASGHAPGSDRLTGEALTTAIGILRRYLGLLLALRDTTAWDLESARVVTRERTRLELAIDDIDQRIRSA